MILPWALNGSGLARICAAEVPGMRFAAAQQGIASDHGLSVLPLQLLFSIRLQDAGRSTQQVMCTACLQHSCVCSAGYSEPSLPICAVHEH